ncbi:arylamine N-acetyltransferase [Pigmentiphaga sp. YJ18]|uniref:arylamine N-acetyltransferase family protein n=1 Tax=Pigmentiphaga sp. YJ18 TaxID=3134907 RepID=UPI003113E4D1
MGNTFDIDAYLARLGYQGSTAPSLAVLDALTRAHSQTIPFENLDVLLRRPIHLDPQRLYDKLVTARRGGYCFELNGLFLELLARLGFAVRPLAARVRLSTADRSIMVQRTHLTLAVTLDGQDWITDVGVGATSLTRALRLEDGLVQATSHDTRRLAREDGRWFHQVRHADQWIDVYEFTGEDMPMVDREVANWYTSTHPGSFFLQRPTAALALPEGRRVSLLGKVLKFREADGSARDQELDGPQDLQTALGEHFGIDLPMDALRTIALSLTPIALL